MALKPRVEEMNAARPAPRGEVLAVVEDIMCELTTLRETINALEQRAVPILRREPNPKITDSEPAPSRSAMGEMLRQVCDSVRDASISVQNIIDRMEL